MSADADLLSKINKAVAAANVAEQTVAFAQTELVSRSKEVGLLLLEAKKLYPKVKDFEAFLGQVKGLKLSRAYDLMRLAGGRITDDELKKDARDRKRKSRGKRKPEPEPTAIPPSVTVTENPEASAERRKAEYAEPDLSPAKRTAASARSLAEFKAACRAYLPHIIVEAHRQQARDFVVALTTPAQDAEAA